MEQDIFREVYQQVHARTCLFQKSILSFLCSCSHSHKTCIAEREGIKCQDELAQKQCIEFIEIMQEKGRFSAKLKNAHGSHIRLQVGTLRGLNALLNNPDINKIDDVYGLILQAKTHFNDLDQLPFEQILPHINRYQGRQRRSRRPKK